MVRTNNNGGIKSDAIVSEVECRPCLFDTNHPQYGERAAKARCWEEVCERIVPNWSTMDPQERFSAGKEIQKRWRSIRDSYTKSFRQGKCVLPEHCPPGSRRYQYHRQMSFLLRALQNKKPRNSQDKYESFSELSNSPQHPPPDDFIPRIKTEPIEQKPLDLKTRSDSPDRTETRTVPTIDKANQVTIDDIIEPNHNVEMKNPSLEIKIDANSILPEDNFDDDKLFMNSLLPLFKKMDDDTRLMCRIEILKVIRYALQGHKCLDALKMAEDRLLKNRISDILAKDEAESSANGNSINSTLSMTTRSADGSRPVRKRRLRSPSPVPQPPKRRGPGRPRKVRPPPSDSDDDAPRRRRHGPAPAPSHPAMPYFEPRLSEMDEELSKATSVTQLRTPLFMKMYNLERTKKAPQNQSSVQIKTEPLDTIEDMS